MPPLSVTRAGRLKAPLSYKNGEAIVKQGDVPIEPRSPNRRSPSPKQLKELAAPLDGMFLLIEGGAQAVKTYWFDPNGLVVYDYRVGKDRMGDYFGEGDFLGVRSHNPRVSSTCRAPCTVDSGCNGCASENPGIRAIFSLTLGLCFMVHDPKGYRLPSIE